MNRNDPLSEDDGHARPRRAPLPPRNEPPLEAPSKSGEPADAATGMTHDELVAALRGVDGMVDVGDEHPSFHFRGRPFLHFHSVAEGTYADVRFERGDFEPVWAATPRERLELLARVVDHVERLVRARKPHRRRPERGG